MTASSFMDFSDYDRHEQVVEHRDAASGLHAIIAVHNTSRGPALGGCRMWPYENRLDAVRDALRLSRGMTYKSALAGLDLGGGKAVIVGDPRRDKSPQLLRAMGRFIDSLEGRYITAEDSGTTVADMQVMAEETQWVGGIQSDSEHGGDPSPSTAYGVYIGIKAAVKHKLGADSLEGVSVAIQGVGNVGFHLARLLAADGAQLVVTDIYSDNLDRLLKHVVAEVVDPETIYAQAVDVFSPCAMGSAINEATIGSMRAPVIAGAANNQLASTREGNVLHERGTLYVPDYVLNAGGIVDIAYQRSGGTDFQVREHIDSIAPTLTEIFERSEHEDRPTYHVADELAEERFYWNATPAYLVGG